MQFLHRTSKFTIVYKHVSTSLFKTSLSPFVKELHNHYATRRFPDLLYFPHLFRWLNTKIKFKYLRRMWDPEFSEGAFIYGSTQAICRITEIINRDQPEELKHLLTQNAELNLKSDMEYKLTKSQKDVIKLTPNDIKLFVPMKVQLLKDSNQKRRCLVLLKSLSMKWHEDKNAVKLALIVIETEFSRDYTEGVGPEWTISMFDIVQCALIGGHSGTI